MIEKIFQSSRYLVLIAIGAASVSAIVLYFGSLSVLIHLLMDLLQEVPTTTESGKMLAVKLLKILDLLLIAITLQTISVSLYRLFITPLRVENSTFLNVLNIKSFHDLKITIIQVSIVIMVILFLEQSVELGARLELLYFGSAVALVILASVYASRHMR
ncbi:putative membrane protein YqhA [Desulfosalsimonas propionicica]|uniref:Putative membrane protein YqhA n=1 Tax=Desulfosalsimonas propionicica TaxID=332175 RepID=A0A7W0C8X8_9BACT|nr:YqhA family protein [Desulfosalsimonas propionicica]MBA2881354.1 putative membrane protein YqhA [Desulfosalsimonas propionicica]